MHKVVQVLPTEEYKVYVYFEDGHIVCYNAEPLLSMEVFKPISDIDIFMNTCTVMNNTLAWDISGNRDETSCLDIDPETLYSLSESRELIA